MQIKTIIAAVFAGLVLAGCLQNESKTAAADTKSSPDTTKAPSEKSTIPAERIKLSIKEGSVYDKPTFRPIADSAFIIASAVFNSPEFKERIGQLSFKYSSNCLKRTSCKYNEADREERIAGSVVLHDLFSEKEPVILFRFLQAGDALGKTCPGQYDITAFYDNIIWDMRDDTIPPSYKIAVNLCHEYMHQVGYCHIYSKLREANGQPDKRYIDDDVTYRVGWEAFYLLVKWYKEKRKIEGL